MKDGAILKVVGLVCITASYICAASHGYDGMLFTATVTALAAIVGVEVGRYAQGKGKA